MRIDNFIGVDPGPTPGIVHLNMFTRRWEIDVIQCTERTAPLMLWALLDSARNLLGMAHAVVQIEKFVIGRGSMKSGAAGATTRDLIGKLEREIRDLPNVTVVQRPAAQVKPWATDARLDKVGLLDATKGMRHARDAARHALYAACKDGGIPDPLSRQSRSPSS